MTYYIIRIVIIIIIAFIFCLIHKVKPTKSGGNIKKLNPKRKIVAQILIFLLVLSIIFYPYESHFIHFSTPEKSVKYSVPNSVGSNITTIEDNDTAFIILNRGNNFSFHSTVKYDWDYGFCDYKTNVNTLFKSQYLESDKFKGIVTLKTIYNKATNTTCYFACLIGELYDSHLKVFDDKSNEFIKLEQFENSINYFYLISKDSPDENINIVIDDKALSFS